MTGYIAPLRLRLDGDALLSNWRWLARQGGAPACGAAIKAELKPSSQPCALEWIQAKSGGTPQRLDAKGMTLHTAGVRDE